MSASSLEQIISLNQPCWADLKLWITFLRNWNGITFFYDEFLSLPCDISLFTDAAPSTGFGGFYRGRWFASTWPPERSNSSQAVDSTALFELYPIVVVAAYLWGSEWSTKIILFHCDNSATVHCISKGRSNSPKIMPFLRRLIWISACHQLSLKLNIFLVIKMKSLMLYLVLFFRSSEHWPRMQTPTNSNSSLFRTLIPLDHPLSHLHTLSINTILQAISPRTLQTYWTAWNSFKIFHRAHNLVFPEFSLLSISSFITYLRHTNSIKPGSIKVYLSGIHLFISSSTDKQCPNISNPQIFLLIKDLQKPIPPVQTPDNP